MQKKGHAEGRLCVKRNIRAVACVEVGLSTGVVAQGREHLGELGLACAGKAGVLGQCRGLQKWACKSVGLMGLEFEPNKR